MQGSKMTHHHDHPHNSMLLILVCLILAAVVPILECRHVAGTVKDPEKAVKPDIELVEMEVDITNNLEGKQNLQVHCKDKKQDFGVHHVPYGQTYKFEFHQAGGGDDYYCGFVFDNVLHWFDIYVFTRDYRRCGVYAYCTWVVNQNGACLVDDYDPPDCYPWN